MGQLRCTIPHRGWFQLSPGYQSWHSGVRSRRTGAYDIVVLVMFVFCLFCGRTEFEYWYPMDLRCSAKDLIPNHLTMALYNHASIWKDRPELWWVLLHVLIEILVFILRYRHGYLRDVYL